MKQQLLLLKDVFGLGVKGQLVFAKPGYMRNFLIPKGFAVVATENMKRRQKSLEIAQAEQAVKDKKDSELLATQIEAISLEIFVKVDPMGRMHGSVRALDIVQLFLEQGLVVERNNIVLNKPIKETGSHKIMLNLKGGIQVTSKLYIIPEGGVRPSEVAQVVAAISPEDAEAVDNA
jgi:large subunit ribosomal protein L9